MSRRRFHAALMTQDELPELKENLVGLEPFVDSITVVDGGSTDGTVEFLKGWASTNGKIRLFQHPWEDNFPRQRNKYLRHAAEVARDRDWIVSFDPDEFLDLDSRQNLHQLCDEAERRGFYRVGFQCRSVTLNAAGERIHQSLDDYRKGLLYRWHPKLEYFHDGEGPVHESLRGLRGPDMNLGWTPGTTSLCYEHRKLENIIWVRGARNYFMGGGGPNLGYKNPRWVELREWCASTLGIPFEVGVKSHWSTFHAYLKRGNVDPWLKEWMFKYRWENGWDGASEQREYAKMYFRLYHPNEEPDEMKGEQIP